MNSQSNIAILVLAAGSSSRMGAPKQLLPWKDTFLLNHVIGVAGQLKNSPIYIVLGAHYDLITKQLQDPKVNLIENKNWEKGLGSSVAIGVQKIGEDERNVDGILMIVGDQPLIDSQFLQQYISAFKKDRKQIVASAYPDGNIGVPALFDKHYFLSLTKLNQDKGAKQIIEQHSEFVSTINAEKAAFDIDTEEEYDRLYRLNHQ